LKQAKRYLETEIEHVKGFIGMATEALNGKNLNQKEIR